MLTCLPSGRCTIEIIQATPKLLKKLLKPLLNSKIEKASSRNRSIITTELKREPTAKALRPAAITLCFAYMTIRLEEITVLDFLSYAVRYFISTQQQFEWR